MQIWSIGGLVLVAVSLGAIFGLLGSVIGSFFILRTRRDGYEPLIPPLKSKEVAFDAYNVDDVLSEEDINSEIEKVFKERAGEDVNNPLYEMNNKMKEQMNV